jgi:hypothetical protein
MATPTPVVNRKGLILQDFFTSVRKDHRDVKMKKGTEVPIVNGPTASGHYVVVWSKYKASLKVASKNIRILPEPYYTDVNIQHTQLEIIVPYDAVDEKGDAIKLEKGDLCYFNRMASNGMTFLVDIHTGPDVGRRGIRIPVGVACLGNRSLGYNGWLHQRVTFNQDYTALSEHRQPLHNFKKGENTACVRAILDDGKAVAVTSPRFDGGQTWMRVDFWAVDRSSSTKVLETDMMGHACRVLKDFKSSTSTNTLKALVVGVIDRFDPVGKRVRVVAPFNIPYEVPFSAVQIGVPATAAYRLRNKTPLFTPSHPLFAPTTSNDVIMNVFAGILKGLDAENAALPSSGRQLKPLYDTSDARLRQAQAFKAGLSTRSATYMTRNRCLGSIEELMTLPDATTSTKAGVYIRIYQNFSSSSPYSGQIFIYVGKTKEFRRRGKDYRSAVDHVRSTHMSIMKAARSESFKIIWTQTKGSTQSDDKQRSLMESVITMLANSMRGSVMRGSALGKEPEKVVIGDFNYWQNSRVSVILKIISDTVFQQFGFSYPDQVSKNVQGVNVRCPLLGGGIETSDPRRYIRHLLGDRQVLSFGGYDFQESSSETAFMQIKFDLGSGGSPGVNVGIPQEPDYGLEKGTRFWLNWEVMAKGLHSAPFFRIPKIGCFENWDCGNKLGLRIFWRNANDNEWYAKFVQTGGEHYGYSVAHEQGALASYVNGTAMFGFLTRSYYGHTASDRPSFCPETLDATVLELKIDRFMRTISIEPVTGERTELPRIVRKVDAAANEMRAFGFDNVDGAWQGFTPKDLKADPTLKAFFARTRAFSSGSKYITPGRKACDHCLHVDMVRTLEHIDH